MKTTKQIAGLSIVALALISGSAIAQTASSTNDQPAVKTREQVRAELVAAQRAGEIPVGFVAVTKRELDPAHYSAPSSETQLARARAANDKSRATQ